MRLAIDGNPVLTGSDFRPNPFPVLRMTFTDTVRPRDTQQARLFPPLRASIKEGNYRSSTLIAPANAMCMRGSEHGSTPGQQAPGLQISVE